MDRQDRQRGWITEARATNDRKVAEGNSAKDGPVRTVLTRTETGDEPWPVAAGTVGLPPSDPARYQPMGEFARGGLGRIMKVHDLRIGRIVAIKEMLRTGEALHARFVREATIAARLSPVRPRSSGVRQPAPSAQARL
jgi:hypothetical protein